MAWCGENLWDGAAWRSEGLPLSTPSDEAAKYFDASVRQYVSWVDCDALGGLEECLARMRRADSSFVLGSVLATGLELMGTGRSPRLDEALARDVKDIAERAQGAALTHRERLHAKAVVQFAQGEMGDACATWESVLAEQPKDLLALKFSHDAYFYLGRREELRDSVKRVLPAWSPKLPLHGHLQGMLAFGLEECGEYAEAEKAAHKALEINRQDAWATHALAHVYEMGGRTDEGLKFLSTTLKDWEPCAMLACHNHWHWALYHVERGDLDLALAVFDREVAKRVESGAMLDIVDAASLLLRLQMEGVDVGEERWGRVREFVAPHTQDHLLVFNDAHMAMALGDGEAAESLSTMLGSLASFATSAVGTNASLSASVGEPLLRGMAAYQEGDWAGAAEALAPLDVEALRPIGGSNAQRDVFDILRVQTHLRSPVAGHREAGLGMLAEREARKPASPLNARLRANYQKHHPL